MSPLYYTLRATAPLAVRTRASALADILADALVEMPCEAVCV